MMSVLGGRQSVEVAACFLESLVRRRGSPVEDLGVEDFRESDLRRERRSVEDGLA